MGIRGFSRQVWKVRPCWSLQILPGLSSSCDGPAPETGCVKEQRRIWLFYSVTHWLPVALHFEDLSLFRDMKFENVDGQG
jgi:hypothetical protein